LTYAESEKWDFIVSWDKDGRAFTIHDPLQFYKKFFSLFFPKEFDFHVFMTSLIYWGFQRPSDERKEEGKLRFYHPKFVRGHREWCYQIDCQKDKTTSVELFQNQKSAPSRNSQPAHPRTSSGTQHYATTSLKGNITTMPYSTDRIATVGPTGSDRAEFGSPILPHATKGGPRQIGAIEGQFDDACDFGAIKKVKIKRARVLYCKGAAAGQFADPDDDDDDCITV
jgi:hypothetical protein